MKVITIKLTYRFTSIKDYHKAFKVIIKYQTKLLSFVIILKHFNKKLHKDNLQRISEYITIINKKKKKNK